jgi:hypothetical protein
MPPLSHLQSNHTPVGSRQVRSVNWYAIIYHVAGVTPPGHVVVHIGCGPSGFAAMQG